LQLSNFAGQNYKILNNTENAGLLQVFCCLLIVRVYFTGKKTVDLEVEP